MIYQSVRDRLEQESESDDENYPCDTICYDAASNRYLVRWLGGYTKDCDYAWVCPEDFGGKKNDPKRIASWELLLTISDWANLVQTGRLPRPPAAPAGNDDDAH